VPPRAVRARSLTRCSAGPPASSSGASDMTVAELHAALEELAQVPDPVQAFCLAVAAQQVWPVWSARCQRLGLHDPAPGMLDCFALWLEAKRTDADLDAFGARLQELVPQDIRKDADPPGAFAGWVLRDVPLTALGQGEDVHDDIVFTAVLYAAAAACGRGADAANLALDALTEKELQFIGLWWQSCKSRVPQLRGEAS
jgi:hypothetical protein